MAASAYPLDWPDGQLQTAPGLRKRARFQTAFARARDGIVHELKLLGCPDWKVVISTNIELRRDGLPYAGRKPQGSPGVAVYFHLNDQSQVIACDCWDRIEDNMRAIEKTIAALRGIERWGSSEMMLRAFGGFKALPSGGDDWRSVFGIDTQNLADVKAVYRIMAAKAHPDQGGNEHEMVRLNQAMEAAQRELQ